MNKRRDALRRGIRSLIHATSRELADLEGRPHPAEVPVAEDAPAPKKALPDAPRLVSREPAGAVLPLAPAPLEPHPLKTPPPEMPPRKTPPAPGAEAAAPGSPGQETGTASPVAEPKVAWIVGPPATRGEPAVRPPAPKAPPPPRTPAGPRASRSAKKGGSHRGAERPARAVRKPARPARRGMHRTEPEASVNGVDPRQAQSRKGVCFAYFINNECWRVPDAYCNTALQVCALRNCPVYHLHRDALERRFARKFKHLW